MRDMLQTQAFRNDKLNVMVFNERNADSIEPNVTRAWLAKVIETRTSTAPRCTVIFAVEKPSCMKCVIPSMKWGFTKCGTRAYIIHMAH